MAFRASDGEFLWQMTHEKLAAGRANDWPHQGVASSPLVDGDRIYYVSNRAELVCLDIQGFRDGENDGPVKDEKLTSEKDGDVVWKLDMIAELGTFPHNLANSSPVSFGDLVYVSTSNGHDESHVKVPSPRTPALIAVHKATGKLVWQDNSVGDRILHGQWASPTVGRIGGVDQVMMGQGDGWIRGYEALTGKKLWEFDTNPKDSVWPKTRNEMISTAVVHDGARLRRQRPGPRARRRGRPPLRHRRHQARRHHARPAGCGTSTRSAARSPPRPCRTASSTTRTTAASSTPSTPRRGSRCGRTTCSRRSGARRWSPTGASTWATRTATSSILQAGRVKKVLGEMAMGSSVYSTPVPAGGVLYIANRSQLVRAGGAK